MINKVKRYVKEQHMFAPGDYVVAGVSGGADSICLLCMLLELQKTIPMTIHVVHINHCIRKESGEDAAYVEQFCRERRIPYSLVEAKVEEIAARRHISTEEAGREVRYDAFYKILEENRGERRGRIAIAHNANDCCETFLFHLFRGSGLKGLVGIPAVRDVIVRPLLCAEREEIEQYLEINGIHYCIDRTNLEDNYTRNRIRHHILQTACEQISENAVAHIKEACDKIRSAYELIEDMTKQGYEKCVRQDDKGLLILADAYSTLHKTIRGYVLLEAIAQVAGSRKDIETVHVEQLDALMGKQSGRKLDMPYGMEAVREYDGIRLIHRKMQQPKTSVKEYGMIDSVGKQRLEKGEKVIIETQDGRFECLLLTRSQVSDKEIPINRYTKWFDYDKIKSDIVVRNRRPGDFFTMDADNRKKTLKAYLIDEKVPREERDSIYLVTEGQQCLWIVGRRIGNWYKVSEDTKHILKITYSRNNY